MTQLTKKLRRLIDESFGYGLALQGISAATSLGRKLAEKESAPAKSVRSTLVLTTRAT